MPRLARFRWRWPDTLRTVPAVILADEPTSSLDDESCERVAALIEAESARQGATLVVATPRLAASRSIRTEARARSIGGGAGVVNAFLLGARTVRRRPLPAVLTVLLLALGIATVVGAKGSGLQLVLSAKTLK